GGRYDSLAAQFGANIPASGFAYDLDTLVSHIPSENVEPKAQTDVKIMYDERVQAVSIQLAAELRKSAFETVLYPKERSLAQTPTAKETLYITTSGIKCIDTQEKETIFTDTDDFMASKRKECSNLEPLTVALAKGRTAVDSLALLEKAGISFPNFHKDSRKLVFYSADQQIKMIYVKALDVTTYVEEGAADIGIVGR